MFAIGLFASWLGTLCWNEASQRLPPALVGQLIVFETLSALAYAFMLRGQWPQAETIAGIVLLVAGVAAYYLLAKQDLWLRVLALLVLVAAAVATFFTAETGRQLIAFGRKASEAVSTRLNAASSSAGNSPSRWRRTPSVNSSTTLGRSSLRRSYGPACT